MNRFAKIAVLGLASAASVIAPLSQASAGERWRHHNDDALVAGVIGLAAGAIIIGALADQSHRRTAYNQPIYDDPDFDGPVYAEPDDGYFPPQPHPHIVRPPVRQPHVIQYDDYADNVEPWSRDWYRYCANRYRSFNPDTGTFRGNDGRDHFCNAG